MQKIKGKLLMVTPDRTIGEIYRNVINITANEKVHEIHHGMERWAEQLLIFVNQLKR